jgi:hypothetical protein
MRRGLLGLALFFLAGVALADSRLVGQWTLGGQPYAVFNKDGSGTLEGESFRWRVNGNRLAITADGETEQVPYSLTGSTLTLTLEGTRLTLQRAGSSGAKAGTTQRAASPAGGGGTGDSLSRLLLSSAWCTFKYNQITGASSQTRVQFFPNGTYSNSARSDTYTSGRYGSVAGQYGSAASGQWSVRQGTLYLSAPPEQPTPQPVELRVTQNSNGYPIIRADGKEYSQCQ